MKTINKIATITALLLTFGLAGCTKEDSTNKYLPKNAQPGEGVVSEKINNEYKPLEQIELGGKQSSKFEYDDKGNLLNKYTADWKEQTFIRFEYDKQGNPIKTVKTDCKTGVQTITANGQEKKYMNVPDVGWVEVVEEIWRGEKEYHEVRDFEVSYQMGRPYFKEFDVENIEELTEKFNKSLNLKENKDIAEQTLIEKKDSLLDYLIKNTAQLRRASGPWYVGRGLWFNCLVQDYDREKEQYHVTYTAKDIQDEKGNYYHFQLVCLLNQKEFDKAIKTRDSNNIKEIEYEFMILRCSNVPFESESSDMNELYVHDEEVDGSIDQVDFQTMNYGENRIISFHGKEKTLSHGMLDGVDNKTVHYRAQPEFVKRFNQQYSDMIDVFLAQSE